MEPIQSYGPFDFSLDAFPNIKENPSYNAGIDLTQQAPFPLGARLPDNTSPYVDMQNRATNITSRAAALYAEPATNGLNRPRTNAVGAAISLANSAPSSVSLSCDSSGTNNCTPATCRPLAGGFSPSARLASCPGLQFGTVPPLAEASPPTSKNSKTPAKPSKHWSGVERRRMPHHVVERRYRDNLNTQIDVLRGCVPSLADACSPTEEMEDGPSKLPSKAMVIAGAHDYIQQLERQKLQLNAEATALREQVAGLQKLVRCEECPVIDYFNTLQITPKSVPGG